MKQLFLLQSLFLLLCCPWSGKAQDTITVSHQAKSYLIFDAPVSLADVGNPFNYEARIEGNSILLLAKQDSVADTPFYAVVGGEPFTATLSYHAQPEAFYDFRKNLGTQKLDAYQRAALLQLVRQKDLLYAESKENGLRLSLEGILHDHAATYLKFRVENRTSIYFRTLGIGFVQQQRFERRLLSGEKHVHFPVEPLGVENLQAVPPYSEQYFYYVLPLQTLDKKAKLIATLREQGRPANRSVEVEIPARLMRRVAVY
jgi:hypothetical protein